MCSSYIQSVELYVPVCVGKLLPTAPAAGSMSCPWSTDGGMVAADLASHPLIVGGAEWRIQIQLCSISPAIGSQRLYGYGVGLIVGL